VANNTGIDRKNIRRWIGELNDLMQKNNKTIKKTLHPGKKPKTYAVE
jgi:hypothetical protein